MNKPRAFKDLLYSCEYALQKLAEEVLEFHDDPYVYKDISARLRMLVVKSGRNKPLLLEVMRQMDYNIYVPPPENPLGGPCEYYIFKDWSRGGEARRIQNKLLSMSPGTPEYDEARRLYENVAPNIDLFDYLHNVQVMYVEGIAFSRADAIRVLSQKMGTAHEDVSLNAEGVAAIAAKYGEIPALARDIVDAGILVVRAGRMVLTTAASRGLYRPRRLDKVDVPSDMQARMPVCPGDGPQGLCVDLAFFRRDEQG